MLLVFLFSVSVETYSLFDLDLFFFFVVFRPFSHESSLSLFILFTDIFYTPYYCFRCCISTAWKSWFIHLFRFCTVRVCVCLFLSFGILSFMQIFNLLMIFNFAWRYSILLMILNFSMRSQRLESFVFFLSQSLCWFVNMNKNTHKIYYWSKKKEDKITNQLLLVFFVYPNFGIWLHGMLLYYCWLWHRYYFTWFWQSSQLPVVHIHTISNHLIYSASYTHATIRNVHNLYDNNNNKLRHWRWQRYRNIVSISCIIHKQPICHHMVTMA